MFGDAATEIEVDILEYVSNVGVIPFFFESPPPQVLTNFARDPPPPSCHQPTQKNTTTYL